MEKQHSLQQSMKPMSISEHGIPPHLVNGTILKTALTNPGEVSQNRELEKKKIEKIFLIFKVDLPVTG